VQAIDHGFAGSVFAGEQSFTVALPLAAPRHLLTATDQSKITLTWTANTEGDLLRYRIYRSTTSPASIQIDSVAAGATSYSDNNVVANITYFYRITAVNQALQESPFSNEVSAMLSAALFTDISATLEGVMGKVAWGDYDNDGDLDLLLAGFSKRFGNLLSRPVTKIYRNEKGAFVEVGGLIPAIPSTLLWGDYDNDGDLDILLSGSNNDPVDPNLPPTYFTKVFRNDGGGVFTDTLAPLAAENGGSIAWGDYDNDGDLDIFGAKIYQNDNGSFIEASGNSPGAGAFGDYDNDGDLDLLAATKIYRNDNGSFVDLGASVGGSAWGDYDNDGDLDILSGNKIYRNDSGNFVNIAAPLVGNNDSVWGDYDNDGDLDIFTTGLISIVNNVYTGTARIHRNDAGNFTLIDSTSGVYGGSLAWGDYDNDSDLDILLTGRASGNIGAAATIARVYRNNIGASNTAPAPPANLASSASGNAAIFSWNKSTDNQTAQNGLTYNLRLGTTSGGVDKTSPMADAFTGYRRVVQFGNTNHNNRWAIKNLPKGRYYWSVQALDNVFAGSAFAPEQTFVLGDTVWPGDTNNNRLANQADVLPIGLYFNKTGPKRDNASVIWQGQIAEPWSPAAATFADANGDGVVNQADVLPIGLNFGKTHSAQSSIAERNDAPLILRQTNAATIRTTITGNTNPGQDFTIDVVVSEVTDLFGVSFELLYSPTALVDPQKAESGSLMGNDPIFFSNIDKTLGKISIANTRKSGQGGVTGAGVVARIEMRVSAQAVRGQAITLTLQNVTANDPNAQPIALTIVPSPIVVVSVASRQNEALPENFALYANTPNPFNPSTAIHYDLPQASEVRVVIFDMLGKHVRTLVQQQQVAGRYSVVWDGRDENGQIVASGVFIYQLRAGNPSSRSGQGFVQHRKMLLVR